MKRSECTVESLKALGYTAKRNDAGSWRTKSEERDCTERQSKELFEIVVDVVRHGGEVEIRHNNYKYTVNIHPKCTETESNQRMGLTYYLSRPMTEAERLEADLYTGRGKDWDYKYE